MKIKDFIASIKASEIKKNILLLLSGNGLAQLIPLLVYPIITRLFSPSDFGVLAFILSIQTIITQISSGKYELTIALPKQNKDASHLFNMGLTISIVISTLILPGVYLYSRIANNFSIAADKFFWLYFLTIIVFFTTVAQLLNNWSIRHKLFKIIIIYSLILNISTAALRLIFGIFFVKDGLIISLIISQVISVVYFYYAIKKTRNNPEIKPFNKEILPISKTYINFPKYLMFVSFINSVSGNLPIFILNSYFNEYLTGQFAIASTILFKPITIYSGSVQQVLLQKSAELKNNNMPILPFLQKFVSRVFLLSIVPLILLIILAPAIINLFLGSNWSEAGKFCQLILPWAFLVFLSSSLSFIPNLFNKQPKSLFIDLIYLVLRIIALLIGIIYKNAFIGIGFFAAAGVIIISYQLYWYRNLLVSSDKDIS